ncbi:PAS domain-containing protein [Shewanella colwelliana]|uniref:Sensor histidine kinase n=1 Tax=Shewanella colwelliana TaxID=23 RepID=A0ABQ4PDX2_SHECO|nr:PAS domain-containing protein [Shewanella colwelliana]MDX1280281.1 PAS domain-containing protein [Shewanella colwelliana]GIU45725.1 sensor histidine kinase [Shewanella colwelliana]
MRATENKNKGDSQAPLWRDSLTFKFTVVQFVVAALIIASSIWLIFSTEQKHHMDTQLSLSQNHGLSVIAQLQQITSKIEALAVSIGIVGATYRDQESLIEQIVPPLLAIEENEQLIISGGLWPEPWAFSENKQRNSYFWAREKNLDFQFEGGYNTEVNTSYHNEFWYKPAKYLQNGHTHWSKSYIDPHTNAVMITASVPMRVEHNFIGVATVDVSLNALNERLRFSDKNPLSKGYLFVLDSFNNLLSDPFYEAEETPLGDTLLGKPLETLIEQYPALSAIDSSIKSIDSQFAKQVLATSVYQDTQLDDLLNNTAQSEKQRLSVLLNASVQHLELKQDPVIISLESGPIFNEPVLISIFQMPQTYWKIVLVTPLSSLSQQANAIAIKIGAFLLLAQLIALFVLFIFQHKLFIRPIFQIVSALQSGNLGRLELDANRRNDEVGQLAKAFIARSNQLEIAYASLDAGNLALEQQLAMQIHAQQELEAKKELINSLLNASQNLICIKDINGHYTLINDKFCEVLGIERQQILNRLDSDIYPKHIAAIIAAHDQLIIESDKAQSFEQPIPTVQGERTYLITKYPIKDSDDNLIALGAMAVDISSLKEKYEEQRQTSARLSITIDALRKSLTLAEAKSTALREQLTLGADASQKKGQLARIESEQLHILPQVVEQLFKHQQVNLEQLFLSFHQQSSIQAPSANRLLVIDRLTQQIDIIRHTLALLSRSNGTVKSINLAMFIQDVTSVLHPQLAAKNVDIEVNCATAVTINMAAWDLFTISYQILSNTLIDGFGQTYERDTAASITIDISAKKDYVILRFHDNGSGLSSDMLARIQQQLKQQRHDGTLNKLNLWLSERYEGEIKINSVLGRYTEITVSFNPNLP